MTQDKDQLRRRLPELLTPAKNKPFYICPICGSGTKSNKTAAAKLQEDGVHLKCFACDFYGDLFDVLAHQYNLSTAQSFATAEEIFGSNTPLPLEKNLQKESPRPMKDFRQYIDRCHTALQECEKARSYLHNRGLTDESIYRFALGFDETEDCIVIPYDQGGSYYIRRSIEGKEFRKPPVSEAGAEPIFNEMALYDGDVCFVAESQLCAISIEQVGGRAIALGGSGMTRLVEILKAKPTKSTLVLALDNDDAGEANTEKLTQSLSAIGVNTLAINISGNCKDPNEALQHDSDALQKAVAAAITQAGAVKQAERDAYMQNSVAACIDAFLGEVTASADTPVTSTGFKNLDEVLDGGLFEGLVILGASTSMGKTTLALQIVQHIAERGRDVLFFSLEMSKYELIAKCISRITYERCNENMSLAKTAREISSGERHANYSTESRDHIQTCANICKTISSNLLILEGCGDIGVNDVRNSVQHHIEMTGNHPVVFIDYLQILAPFNDRASDKQNMDKAITELKRISRDFKIPVVAASSLNRASYNKDGRGSVVDMADFKESGGIEYGADVLLALQFPREALGDKATQEQIEDLKRQEVRKLQVKVLKGRNGPTGGVAHFEYRPAYNHFAETETNSVVKKVR